VLIILSDIAYTFQIEDLLLGGGVEDYEYLNKSRREVDGVDDMEEWSTLQVSFMCF
jgi:myosin heavy subunit